MEIDHTDLLGPPVDNSENEHIDEESDQEEQEDDEREGEMRPDWMILSDMRPDAVIETSSGLGLRDIDQSYDWVGDVRRNYPNLNLADIDTLYSNLVMKALLMMKAQFL